MSPRPAYSGNQCPGEDVGVPEVFSVGVLHHQTRDLLQRCERDGLTVTAYVNVRPVEILPRSTGDLEVITQSSRHLTGRNYIVIFSASLSAL
mgnify:CR=1 FL=1